jgi:hypothetical protein
MRYHPSTPRLSLLCIAFLTIASACGDDSKEEAGDGTADTGETADGTTAPETSGATMEGDGDGDGGDGDGDAEAGDGDGDQGDGDGDAEAGDGDGDQGDGDGDAEAGDGDGDPNSPCADYETQEACEDDSACQALFGQGLLENGPDAPCLEASEYVGCIASSICDDALTWFCVGGNQKPILMSSGCGPEGAEMCDPGVQDPPECP